MEQSKVMEYESIDRERERERERVVTQNDLQGLDFFYLSGFLQTTTFLNLTLFHRETKSPSGRILSRNSCKSKKVFVEPMRKAIYFWIPTGLEEEKDGQITNESLHVM